MKIVKIILILVTLSSVASAWFLPYKNPNKLPYPQFVDLDTKIMGAWGSYKEEYVESNGLVFKDKDYNYNNQSHFVSGSDSYKYSVSEGIGYVMMIALYMNDQTTFDKVWSAGKTHFGFPNLSSSSWLVKYSVNNVNSVSQGPNGQGSATDADADVAMALVFASVLVDNGLWNGTGKDYKSAANTLIDDMYSYDQKSNNRITLGSTDWNSSMQNPSYFTPAYYRVFDDFQGKTRWNTLINNVYNIYDNVPGYSKGITPNWVTNSGSPTAPSGGTGSDETKGMGFEAIRYPWRIATDAIWFGGNDAKEYCENAMSFGSDPVELGTGMFEASSPYEMLEDKSWLKSTPSAMWGSCAGVVSQDILNAYGSRLASTYKTGTQKFNEDDQYYFATLTLLGALVVSGSYANIYDDLANYSEPTEQFIAEFATNLEIKDGEVDLSSIEDILFYAKMIESASWEIKLISSETGIEMGDSGVGSVPFFQWRKFKLDNNIFRVGETITVELYIGSTLKQSLEFIIAKMPEDYKETVVDDFNDSDYDHNMSGSWSSISDKDYNGSTTLDTEFDNRVSDNSSITINYDIDRGSNDIGFAGIEGSLSTNGIIDLYYMKYFSFWHKGDAARFELLNPNDDKNEKRLGLDISEHEDWTKVLVVNTDLDNPNSSLSGDKVLDSISYFRFVTYSDSKASGSFSIDEFVMNGDYTVTTGEVAIADYEVVGEPSLSVYPNPFNPVVNIQLNSMKGKEISANIYDLKGRKIKTLYKGDLSSNNKVFTWNASRNASGIYFLRVKSSGKIMNKKLLLVK